MSSGKQAQPHCLFYSYVWQYAPVRRRRKSRHRNVPVWFCHAFLNPSLLHIKSQVHLELFQIAVKTSKVLNGDHFQELLEGSTLLQIDQDVQALTDKVALLVYYPMLGLSEVVLNNLGCYHEHFEVGFGLEERQSLAKVRLEYVGDDQQTELKHKNLEID